MMNACKSKAIPDRIATMPEEQSRDLCHTALRMIRLRACEGTPIKQIGDSLGVSRSTLERLFLKNFGCTPSHEVSRVRMARAEELLANTELSIKNIAHMVGYRRISNFGDFFRRHAGVSPLRYRQARGGTGVTYVQRSDFIARPGRQQAFVKADNVTQIQ
jgi:transcriptional regulator GlxA family with amidase domain